MATSLFDWIMHLLRNPEAREHFDANPKAAMASAGMGSVCGQDVRDAKAFLLDHPSVHSLREDGAPPSDHAHDQIRHILKHHTISPKHAHETRVHESNSRVDDHGRQWGVGPTSHGSTGSDQAGSRVAHDQVTLGGHGNLMGDGNDSSEHLWQHEDDHSDNSHWNHTDDHGYRANVSGNGSAGHDLKDTRVSNSVNGNGSAGRDIHAERSGPILGQGVAGGDIDHTGGLAGLDHTVSVGNVNLLSGLVNTGDVLNGSPVLSGDLNNSLNHSLNDLARGSLDDVVHNIDIHDIPNLAQNVLQHVLA